ncbi:MAG: extracellular solute-binding protein, partial [Eubacteriales bacterium]|nr:extracellular solute-binding protein [Eubacteriales bacterium]
MKINKKINKKIVSLLLGTSILASGLVGCGSKETNNTSDTTNSSNNSKYEEFITVDVFDGQANYQGIQTGWFGQMVKEKFNMELNIIAPNVAGGGDTLFQTRSAAGNLGDIIIVGAGNNRLQDLVTAGLVTDMTDLIKDAKNLKVYEEAIKKTNDLVEEDGIYAIPSEISPNPPESSAESLDPTFGAYLRWDIYKQIGYPEMNTAEDLLPVLKQMQEAYPETENGKKTYGFSLFKDWDGNIMTNAKFLAGMYGYNELGFVLEKADGTEIVSMIDENSPYIRGLKLLFEANQLGLIDPESTTQNYDQVFAKYQNGQVLFSLYSWLGKGAFNTPTNKNEGKGYMLAEVKDQQVYTFGSQYYGNPNNCIMIGSGAKDKQRMADFIDWLYSPEGVMASTAQTDSTCGPEGLTWEMKDGQPVLTEFGEKALFGEDVEVPAEYGGGTWKDGISQLNYKAVNHLAINPDTGFTYNHNVWESVLAQENNPLINDWREKMGANYSIEFLEKNNQIAIEPGSGYNSPPEGSKMTTLRGQIKSAIVENSWKMVFAKDENEFNSYLQQMRDTAYGLG